MQSRKLIAGMVAAAVLVGAAMFLHVVARSQAAPPSPARRLAVVWSSGDPDVAHRVCLMYTTGAKRARWFDEVQLIVWGPSARLLAGDKDLQAEIKKMMALGVDIKACVVCADLYGVTHRLRELGIEVKPMGKPLSRMLQSDWKVITF